MHVTTANWRSRCVTVCFTCARNIVLQHQINFCLDVDHVVCFPCVWLCLIFVSFKVTDINIGIVCVYFEFIEHMVTSKMVSNQPIVNTKISWTHAWPSANLLGLSPVYAYIWYRQGYYLSRPNNPSIPANHLSCIMMKCTEYPYTVEFSFRNLICLCVSIWLHLLPLIKEARHWRPAAVGVAKCMLLPGTHVRCSVTLETSSQTPANTTSHPR